MLAVDCVHGSNYIYRIKWNLFIWDREQVLTWVILEGAGFWCIHITNTSVQFWDMIQSHTVITCKV